ncbi:hypothetical protein [Pseudochrobactrum sp. HB0163]|uniref:hypothetical protein n=1 Tax=Pseudochrobactrum sp. HB0163 TaxID=3450708 RepID=UPI003F6E0571
MSNMLNLLGLTGTEHTETNTMRPAAKSGKTTLLSVQALRHAAARMAELRADGASLNTREFVGLLVCNAQRSRRISLPQASLRIATNNPDGRIAIRLRLR